MSKAKKPTRCECKDKVDAEPVTEDWLRSEGFKSEFVRREQEEVLYLEDDLGWPVSKIVGGSWAVYSAPLQYEPKTRGEVRRLCAALGVPLTAPATQETVT